MTKQVAIAVIGSIFIIGAVTGPAVGSPEESKGAEVTVRLYDQAGIGAKKLERARGIVDRIFRLSGVSIRWVPCATDGSETKQECVQLLGNNEITLRIVSRSLSEQKATGHFTGGRAHRIRNLKGAGFASIFVDRLEKMVAEQKLSLAIVLGHIIAHEVGHILLPQNSHSRRGLMRSRFQWEDWQQANQGRLHFTKGQAKKIVALVLAGLGEREKVLASAD